MERLPRAVAALLGLAAAGLGAVAVQGGRFWVLSDGNVAVGPVSTTSCGVMGDGCQVGGLGWIGGGSELWLRAGIATYAAGIILGLAFVIFAAAVAAGKRGRLAAGFGLVAAATAAGAGTLFVATFPGFPGAELGRGALFLLLAVVCGTAAGVIALRAKPVSRRRVGIDPVPAASKPG